MILCPPLSAQSKEDSLGNCPYFATLAHNAKTLLAVQDIESNKFWKAVYCLLRDVVFALRLLGFCDANKPAMDKIFYLCDRVENVLLSSSNLLRNHSLVGFLEEEFTEGGGGVCLHKE